MKASDLARYTIPDATPDNPWQFQRIVRKSRFLAQICNCGSREECREFWQQIKSLHPDATHNCWAFIAGPPGDTACIGYSDDGEPGGTAGRPMLNVLLHCGIGQICVVVSRWFGGIKLGAGGLARAYQDAVQGGLQDLPLAWSVASSLWRITVNYPLLEVVRRMLPEYEAIIERSEYGEVAELTIKMPLDLSSGFDAALATATNGRVRLEPLAQ